MYLIRDMYFYSDKSVFPTRTRCEDPFTENSMFFGFRKEPNQAGTGLDTSFLVASFADTGMCFAGSGREKQA